MFSISSPFKGRIIIIFSLIVIILITIRIYLPAIILRKTNQYLNSFSPTYSIHVKDVGIGILRGSYRFEDVVGKIKTTNEIFLNIKKIECSIDWKELFKGKILADIRAERLEFLILKNISQLYALKKESLILKEHFLILDIERFDLVESTIVFEDYKSFTDKSNLKITNINGRITNITPNKKFPISYFNITANLIDLNSKIRFVGELKSLEKPLVWNVDTEIRDFKITSLNPYLKRHMPLTFSAGTMDLYSEAISEKGHIEGYIKPFFRELVILPNKEKLISPKHFGIEIVTTIINLILRESKTKSISTILDFTYDKKLKIKKSKAISKAFQHDFTQQLSPGIENRYHIN